MSSATRRLSFWRLVIAAIVAVAVAAGGLFAYQAWASTQAAPAPDPWFAAYVDVTATPSYEFESAVNDSGKEVMLSFIVAATDDACTPTWGTAYTMDEAAVSLDLDRRIARLQQQGGDVGVSFGGLLNDELATSCTDHDSLVEAYSSVIDRYASTTIDLDIEGENLSDTAAGERRAAAIADLQQSRRAAGDDLAVWLTLPAATFGLTEDGTTAVTQMLDAGVDVSGVNIMTMNFGQSMTDDETSGDASIRALQETHRQLGILYDQAGIELTDATLWTKLGATPMIGQNDNEDEVFTMDDATTLNEFTTEQGIGRMSMWSLNRDTTCGPNYADVTRVSDACSGVDQGDLFFADVLAENFEGELASSAKTITTQEPSDPADLADDPATSPYAIWDEDASYLAGTKVVLHRNVYQAKWWTRGDVPDNPVLNSWETPWTLVGPVLEGETPVEVPTVPDGTYPNWDGTSVYEEEDRVLFDGVPYEAKWWTQGDSPAAFSSDPDGSPWIPLTSEEVKAIADSSTIDESTTLAPASTER
ncbi:glycosyl hydrolase family 18 [Salinibacterium sp. NSLL150]|uniref:chitinase n=1 Tax=unclassified Salinibacterium TaxID=2632331 RepID=UPI0018CF34D1|nr:MULTISPECIES: carbohydrate-binding protein [unclassified Salinibacterium]MBH0099701.1 glycosyl hydrolase family 18 [Salinibacterium sp. NSLL35]MBH0102455.1 glycosyl hydrolase family 18 [Salinibacterium sp. NSLL150]MBH0105215.1 glycosyl hydrolase family 18 [Salinibacterium sp. NSLL16]MBH0107975.1 glycosyl hydrolase family 18 [Salinibacterium sp. NSLL17]